MKASVSNNVNICNQQQEQLRTTISSFLNNIEQQCKNL